MAHFPTVVLQIEPPRRQSFSHTFQDAELTIGRSSANDLPLPDLSLSRLHAKLFWSEGTLHIDDCKSRNGTFLNGVQVVQAHPVMAGDTIQASESLIRIRDIQTGAIADRHPSETSTHTILRPVDVLLRGQSNQVKDGEDWSALQKYAERLTLLNEVHEAAAKPMPLQNLLELILDQAYDHLGPETGAIFLRKEDNGFETAAYRSKYPGKKPLEPSQKLVTEVANKGLAALVFDTQTDRRFSGSESIVTSGIRSLMAAPILNEDKPLGLIVLSSKAMVRQFSEDDLSTLVSVAAVASLKIRNATLVEASAQRRIYQRELAIARKIQVSLLPRSLPCPPGYQIEGKNLPSQGVSGDFYQVTQRAIDGRLVMMVADVSGKGIAASLLVGSLEALAAAPVEDGLPPDQICEKLSRLLHARTSRERYATLFLAMLDPESGVLTYANAGHPAALLLREAGHCEPLPITGVPIGIFRETSYQAGRTIIHPGETLVIFTDGLIEARNENDEEFGVNRLDSICSAFRDESVTDLFHSIDEAWQAFANDTVSQDDRTLLLLKRESVPENTTS